MAPLCLFILLITSSYVVGDSLSQRCCSTGAKLALSPTTDCQNLPKVAGITLEETEICTVTMTFCCERERILHECNTGIKRAQQTNECRFINDTSSCSSGLEQTCCSACILVQTVSEIGSPCDLPGPHTIAMEQVTDNCCPEKESEENEDNSGSAIKLNLCEQMPNQLCEHICVPTPNSYICRCRRGFILMEDQKTCQPEKREVKSRPTIITPILPNPEKPVPLKKPTQVEKVPRKSCFESNDCEHVCSDTASGPKCSCRTGYELKDDKTRCQDINECLDNIHVCDPGLETCINEIGNYRCEARNASKIILTPSTAINLTTNLPIEVKKPCTKGYERIEKHCVDIDECDSSRNPELCEPNETCINTVGSYACMCGHGFQRDPVTKACVDVNECQQNMHSCLSEQRCDNTIGSYLCSRVTNCGTGYTFNVEKGVCEDDDECELRTHTCSFLGAAYQCRNTLGSFRCERKRCYPGEANCTTGNLCPNGFKESTTGQCVDIDECKERLHNCNPAYESCINRVGTFECRKYRFCPKGYQASLKGCDDIDECATNQHNCVPPAECRNHNGGFACVCPNGYQTSASSKCEDINECLRYVCPQAAECINLPGSYRCNCKHGFRQVSPTHCEDLDECNAQPGACDHRCLNVYGSYHCSCNTGYYLHDNNKTCIDVDECAKFGGRSLCTGECVNVPGSFLCSCPSGYNLRGDGRTCQDIDECLSDPCRGGDEICLNSHGTYMCKPIRCPPGYIKDQDQLNKCRRLPCMNIEECLHKPMTYSFNYITFVSMLPIPSSGYIDLFTMRGPLTSNTDTAFEMQLISTSAPPHVQTVHRDFFQLRNPAQNQAAIALGKSIPGPQEIELQLIATIYHNGILSAKAVANIFVIVSRYEY